MLARALYLSFLYWSEPVFSANQNEQMESELNVLSKKGSYIERM